jgi:ABC-2 type transport system permease protein
VRSTPSLDAALSAWAGVRLGAAGAVAAWPVLLGRAVFYLLLLIVLTALWDKVAAERLPGTLAAALPKGGLALYIGVTEWVTLSVPAIHLRLEDDIRSGALETHLLRPKAYLVQRTAESVGAMLVRLFATGAAALLMLLASGRAWPAPGALAALAVVGPVGALIGVLLYVVAGLSAFWVRRTLPAMLVIQKLMFLLGGLFAPITLYPAWLARLGVASPFAAHLYWPAALMLSPSPNVLVPTIAMAMGAQMFWIALLSGLITLMWRAGLRRVLRGEL